MDYIDLTQLALSNLWRTKLRSTLTILGVVIGIGALSSMVSFGVGLQKNLTDAFEKNDLFTSLNVTSKKINLEEVSSGNFDQISREIGQTQTPLNDSVVNMIREMPGVAVAFPEIRFPVKISFRGKETTLNLSALPMGMKDFYPFNEIEKGRFFSNDSSFELLVREKTLNDLGFKIKVNRDDTARTSGKYTLLEIDSVINGEIDVISKNMDVRGILANPFMAMMGKPELLFRDTVVPFVLTGIVPEKENFGFDRFGGGIIVPLETSKKIPNLGFNSVWDLLGNNKKSDNYGSVYVRTDDMKRTKAVSDSLKQKGLNVFAFSDQLKEIKRAFMIMDSLLGAIGLIALVVAALGIINTMLMSILERTREIGIMKSIGASESEIRTIFFVEASGIGIIGAVFGLGLGWVVTRIANAVMNAQMRPQDLPSVDLFSFPVWLILGSIAFSVVISLAAGLYPAIRAARIDPVKALRHD